MKYEKPLVESLDMVAEGVYAASGNKQIDLSTYVPHCESDYMKGFQPYNGDGTTNKSLYGCTGCRACSSSFCQLDNFEIGDWYVAEYDPDVGFRKPEWEQKGLLPDAPVEYY